MKNYLILGTAILSIAFLFSACGKKKSNRELFNEYLETNVPSCASTFLSALSEDAPVVTPDAAHDFCACTFELFYELDSTFFLKDFESNMDYFNTLLDQHREELFERCGTIIVPDPQTE